MFTHKLLADYKDLKQVLINLHDFYLSRKCNFVPYTTESLEEFRALDTGKQNEILDRLRMFKSTFCDSQLSFSSPDTETPRDEIQLLEAFLKVQNLSAPTNETFEFVERGWVIEAYDLQLRQIYRNPEFLRQCSYDILSLEVFPWPTLYGRADAVTDSILQEVKECLESDTQKSQWGKVRKHLIHEKRLNLNKKFYNDYKFKCPLFRRGKIAGIMNFCESRPFHAPGRISTLPT